MSEMVERVAQIICDADYSGTWFYISAQQQNGYREIARKAIEAMRDPTDEMIKAGEAIVSGGWPVYECSAKDVWQAMNDAAFAGGGGYGEKEYREIFGETVVEREIRKSLERSKECSGVQMNSPQGHTVHKTAPDAQQNEQDDTKSH